MPNQCCLDVTYGTAQAQRRTRVSKHLLVLE